MSFCDIFKKERITFRLVIQDVFTIKHQGIVVTGLIEQGTLHAGDKVILHRVDGSDRKVTVGAIEKYRQGIVKSASQGENVGVFLEEISKDDVGKNDILEGC